VQLEINRALYVDERDSRPKEEGLAALRRLLTELLRQLGELPRPVAGR
jgi:N-formylglutamate amidohydrolase